jgi:hypothetical protein
MGTLHDDLCEFLMFPWILFRIKKHFQAKLSKKSKHTLYIQTFFPKIVPFVKKKKNMVQSEVTDDNKAHALCMLDNLGYTHVHTQNL